jgi:hypothetical protein
MFPALDSNENHNSSSLEIEKQVIGCCLAEGDNGQTFALAKDAGIDATSFDNPTNRLLFEVLTDLRNRGRPLLPKVLLEELHTRNLIEGAVRMRDLHKIAGIAANATRAKEHIEQLSRHVRYKKAVELLSQIQDQLRNANLSEFERFLLEKTCALQEIAISPKLRRSGARSLMSLTASEEDKASQNLLGNGFLRRGQGALMPGATGIGKSSLLMQALVQWALGKPFFGIKPEKPLSSLLVQAENDEIDLVEMRDGICKGLQLSPEEREMVAARIFVLTAHERGRDLFARLEREVMKMKPDLLILDPLFAYMEGPVKDQEAASHFLRSIVQPFVTRHQLGLIILHHTNKPPIGRERPTWQGNDYSYAGSGSSEFANWARAVLFLRSIGKPHVFELLLPKRGKRAGITDANGQPTTKVTLRHSKSPGTICWELAEDSDYTAEGGEKNNQLVKAVFALNTDGNGVPLVSIARRLTCSVRTVRRLIKQSPHTQEGEVLSIRECKVFVEDPP